jgi:hypothetical protein
MAFHFDIRPAATSRPTGRAMISVRKKISSEVTVPSSIAGRRVLKLILDMAASREDIISRPFAARKNFGRARRVLLGWPAKRKIPERRGNFTFPSVHVARLHKPRSNFLFSP